MDGAGTRLAELLRKYADRPMDLADASMVWAAEQTGALQILPFFSPRPGKRETVAGASRLGSLALDQQRLALQARLGLPGEPLRL